MRILATGGGTGGHVYPALEIALGAKARGHQVEYWGSNRGQEGPACEKAGMDFRGFESGPVYRLTSLRGLKSLAALLKVTTQVKSHMAGRGFDAVFATGGYSAAPVLNAARKLGVPLVLHEQNSVPGRTNQIMGRYAFAVCTAFKATSKHFPADKVKRVGMPIRQVLRESAAQGRLPVGQSAHPSILVMGGSQGSQALNDMALSTALRMADRPLSWTHITGLTHFESTMESLARMGIRSEYSVKSYLQAPELAGTLCQSDVAVCRSGAGTLAELAAFRRPSVLVPYPAAFHDHQYYNALEFAELGAADIIRQEDLDPAVLESRILGWLNDPERVDAARKVLAEWDVPDAVDLVLDIVESAGPARK